MKIGSLEKIRNVYLESDTYRIKGVLDEIEIQEDNLYPIEYKKGESNQQLQHHIQLCLQGLLLEEATEQEISKGYIFYVQSSNKVEVYFTQELRELTLSTIDLAFATIEDAIIPEPVRDSRCTECSLLSI